MVQPVVDALAGDTHIRDHPGCASMNRQRHLLGHEESYMQNEAKNESVKQVWACKPAFCYIHVQESEMRLCTTSQSL